MDYLSTLKVKTRLGIGFGILVSLMVTLTVLGIQKVNFIDMVLSEMTDINSVKQRYAINYRGSVHDRAIAIRDIAIARNPQEISALEQEIKELEDFYRESEQNMQAMIAKGVMFTAEERQILAHIDQIQAKTLPLVRQIIADKKNDQVMTEVVLDQARPAFIEWLNTINQFIDYQENLNQTLTPEARGEAGGFQDLMLLLTAIALAISVVVGIAIERSFRKSLGGEPYEAQSAIRLMADGDLTHNYGERVNGSILNSLSGMSTKLTQIVSNIVSASGQLVEQVDEVADGSSRVLRSAQQQASLTQETVDKLDNMRHSIDQIAQVTTQTENNSVMTTDNARSGRELVFDVAAEMENISATIFATVEQVKQLEARTKDIGGIVNVISEISEQTNLLALNAAIEAARAGESGRGFAVVADEVRSLAQRTNDATSQIESMINEVQTQTAASVIAMENTQPQVEKGKEKTSQASQLLVDIEHQAEDTLSHIRDVVQATNEQVEGVRDIAAAMEQISSMSDDSVNSMESNENAGRKLNQLANQLKQEVGFFKI
ncbi:methyl-accepting chemotaxis protein [Vibrio coralliilyticus]|uniref:methyl-accepting chemotaxis protein n=1 Tax=Vibrio coralliilyticus TaxID=190893 RepID=UPI00148DAED1|nr:methyl-accepting chemotaxis protein [Vibrio coralliilyticus]NOI28163.1 methyl-accepting chemotaxis protein [Vibrio coralliilyticus]NOI49104.1 methyl-accepting chemotaxis protein [Vibrio coralliilyticus]NRF28506.1 methyl-accepting chemotaxis protein [Vibrio coralliilyticus]NRF51683.1 methyl-accepting chemotaxis protein [Vibrio coralliilyticus]NRG02934.1 methyl-accepting chemotaxis protein [Vibrio coralliilyticus]